MQTAILRCVVRQINVGKWRCRCFPFENPNEDGVDLPFDDGCTILYVNGAYRGEDAIGRLMHDSCTPDADSMYYSKLAAEARKEALEERNRQLAEKLLRDGTWSAEKIADFAELPLEQVRQLAENVALAVR